MLAPRAGLALPLKTPQPVVCGQFPNSQSPTTGIATAVNKRISSSNMKARPQAFRIVVMNDMAMKPVKVAHDNAIRDEVLALAGWLAPNSFPTRVDTAKLSAEGKIYCNGNASDSKAKMIDEEVVDWCVEGEGESRAEHERECYVQCPQVNFKRVDEGLKKQVWERKREINRSNGGNFRLLTKEKEDWFNM
ncbi:hypothetical protein RJ640_030437 [Escallonia rubra]|uniref:Uncharacterized protein n=1 Tax=Escallonia rubra TaxID=112253 RepID=A0AA88QMM1_9ASTE|nr:hypothetical protein RJ640_030437 [Escallonia rubra]